MLSIQGGDALAVPGLLLKLACETPHVACSDAAHAAREAHAARTRGEEDARRPGANSLDTIDRLGRARPQEVFHCNLDSWSARTPPPLISLERTCGRSTRESANEGRSSQERRASRDGRASGWQACRGAEAMTG